MGRQLLFTLLLLLLPSLASAQQYEEFGYYFYLPEQLTPPAWYRDVYAEMYQCVSIHPRFSDFDQIQWFKARVLMEVRWSVDMPPGYTPWVAILDGVWQSPHTIFLDEDDVENREVVGHEILHDLLGRYFPHEHPAFSECDPLQVPNDEPPEH